ncbi:MAG: hypothetical protein WD011_00190 [Nitriliruptoraceae bacterium]
MTAPHLPDGVTVAAVGVVPLDLDVGVRRGHQLRLLSLERWDGWADLRFARIDTGDGMRLTRRVPPADAWTVHIDGQPAHVYDTVGRGDRSFSNGEVRVVPSPPAGSTVTVDVDLVGGDTPLTATFVVAGR